MQTILIARGAYSIMMTIRRERITRPRANNKLVMLFVLSVKGPF